MAAPSISRHHAEWLALLDISGPFLSLPVLGDVFPQGIDKDRDERDVASLVRDAYGEWQASRGRSNEAAIQRAWIELVLGDVLGWNREVLVEGQTMPPGVQTDAATRYGEPVLRPDMALLNPDDRAGNPIRLLVTTWPVGQDLDKPVADRPWKASPSTRMVELLRATGVRLGLVTNGEQWLLVNAPANETTGYVSWYANLWVDERLTLRAFRALLGAQRFFGAADDQTLEAMLDHSATEQAEVTTQLGNQVRQAVELLVAAIDREDRERGGALLAGVKDAEVYEASITVMMRMVFLLFAEDQRPPLFGENALYDEHYAIGSMLGQLQADSDRMTEDVLERQGDAWSRILATFRLVYAGSEHPEMRSIAYGGSLFDPDRFPFLEGRTKGTDWRVDRAQPLPISNRTVLHMLEAIQLLEMRGQKNGTERRRLSFRALDVEQIGHVYESLLEHTAKRADGIVLGLVGKKEPEIALSDLEAWAGKGTLGTELKERTGRTEAAIAKLLATTMDAVADRAFRTACDNDAALFDRVRPFAALVRRDRADRPIVIRDGGLYVTAGTDRRTSGAHYTPRSLTEPIVQYTMEPLVYVGPAEGTPQEAWRLRPWTALLELTVCDPAMGSGAFLVQTCRYLSERLVEAWDEEERATGEPVYITRAGKRGSAEANDELLPREDAERLALARRLVADHCLYGVDKNPLAVEMAKLSMWLITLQRNRAFTFLDHRLRLGDSLLGVNLAQLAHWSLDAKGLRSDQYVSSTLKQAFERATRLRVEIDGSPVQNAPDAEANRARNEEAQQAMALARLGGDLLIGAALGKDAQARRSRRDAAKAEYMVALEIARDRVANRFAPKHAIGTLDLETQLFQRATHWLGDQQPFHWPLEFPEIFQFDHTTDGSIGFSGMVGNPPFMGGQKLTGAFGTPYRDYLVDVIAEGKKGSADLSAYFLLRAGDLLRPGAGMGMLATNTIAQGDTREVGLDQLIADGFAISRAVPSRKWPGAAALEVAHLWLRRDGWNGAVDLNGERVGRITTYLTPPGRASATPTRLAANRNKAFQGSIVLGKGFILQPDEAKILIAKDSRNREVLFPYLNGEDLNTHPNQMPSRWVINFKDWPIERARTYPICFAIVENNVRPERELNKRASRRERWWQYAERADGLYSAIENLSVVIATARVSPSNMVSIVPAEYVYHDKLVVFSSDRLEVFSILQSSIHWEWARLYTSTLGATTLNYSPSDCFENFPLPSLVHELAPLAERFIALREDWMNRHALGLTSFSNWLHSANHQEQALLEVRMALQDIDQAVAKAYGWSDLGLHHGVQATKQGMRFTIGEKARREVLDRLVELNHQRHAEEVARAFHETRPTSGRGLRANSAQVEFAFD